MSANMEQAMVTEESTRMLAPLSEVVSLEVEDDAGWRPSRRSERGDIGHGGGSEGGKGTGRAIELSGRGGNGGPEARRSRGEIRGGGKLGWRPRENPNLIPGRNVREVLREATHGTIAEVPFIY